MLLIGFTGPAGVGKTTAARIIAVDAGWRFVGFSDPIKEAVARRRGLTPAELELRKRDEPGMREELRFLGDFARSVQWDIFIRYLDRRAGTFALTGEAGVVVHDLRTPDEADWLRNAGGVLVHLTRNGVEFNREHVTEEGVSVCVGDLVIDNPGDVDGLRGKLLSALVDIRRREAA